MITIFNGCEIQLDSAQTRIYAQVSVALRDHIVDFNTGKSLSPFGVFMCIALHVDQFGWSYPSRATLKAKTGIKTDDSLTTCLRHLVAMRIDGHRVLAIYRDQRTDGKFGLYCYRVFPDAFDDQLASAPERFEKLVHWTYKDPAERQKRSSTGSSSTGQSSEPVPNEPVPDHDAMKYNHDQVELEEGESTSADPGVLSSEDAARGPLEMAAECQRRSAGQTQWTVPTSAGGSTKRVDAMLRAWIGSKRMKPSSVPESIQKRWRAAFDKVVGSFETATPDQCARAVQAVLDPKSKRFAYYTYSDPNVAKFRQDFEIVLLEILNEGQPRSGDRSPEHAGQLTGLDAIQARMAKTRSSV